MADTIERILKVGTQEAYDAIESKNDEVLYFCSDTKNMYKGDDLYTDGIRSVTVKPGTPAVGVLYAIEESGTVEYYDGTDWVVIRYPYATEITSLSTDEEIATAGAVYEYVTKALEDLTGTGEVVTSVAASESKEATLEVTKSGATSEVVVPGVVTTPTYDAEERIITFPISDGETVEVNLGKDIFVDPDADNGYDPDTGNIVLYLNDGTEITIPAKSLIDVYTGEDTETASTEVSETNVITVSVKLAEDENNAITVADEGGLMVDLSKYATIAYVQQQIYGEEQDISELSDAIDELKSQVNTLNGDATTEGSVDYKIAEAESDLEEKITTAQETADEAKNQATENAEAITEIQDDVNTILDAFWWGTF